MRSFLVFLQFALLFMCLFSCKRLAYNPMAYDDLLYKAPIKEIPKKEYIFKTTLKSGTSGSVVPKVETSWNTTGTALVNDDTLTITGTNGEDVFTIKLKNYKNQSVFSIGSKRDTATLSVKVAGKTTKYVSKGLAHGKVTIVKLDNGYNQVEANFDMVLYSTTTSTTRPTDSIVVSSGYFKINFSPNACTWEDNGEKLKAQLISATEGDFYEITAVDTLQNRAIVLKIPKNRGAYSNNGAFIPLGYNGTAFFYTDSASNYIRTKALQYGGISINSIADNIIKGEFKDIRVDTTTTDPLIADRFLKGSFSAKY